MANPKRTCSNFHGQEISKIHDDILRKRPSETEEIERNYEKVSHDALIYAKYLCMVTIR
jgi:hypothetical protein